MEGGQKIISIIQFSLPVVQGHRKYEEDKLEGKPKKDY